MNEILRIYDLWGGYLAEVNILHGISMEIMRGEVLGIIGLNGSGKSTFGKAIMNMIPYRQGKILFEGEDVTLLKTNELFHHGITIMQQGGRTFQNLSVWDNLSLSLCNRSPETYEILRSIIPMLQLSEKELKHLMADKLSGGQKHQLSLAMTLATRPRLAILDEPSAGLSPKATEDMYVMLHAVRKSMDVSIILIEQNIAKAVEFCDRCLLLQQGMVIKEFSNRNINDIEKIMFNKE